MKDNQVSTYLALDQAYKTGNTALTSRVEAIVSPQDIKFPEVLELVLSDIKDTPLLEPKLFSILENDTMRLEGFTKALSARVDLDAFDALTASEFISAARHKILDKKDKDGVFKATPAIDQMKLPRISVVKELSEQCMVLDAPEFTELALSVSGLTAEALSNWERELVSEILLSYAVAYATSLGGIMPDRTPFARYLKNG